MATAIGNPALRQASQIAANLKSSFLEHLCSRLDGNSTREGVLREDDVKRLEARSVIDTRPLTILLRSGKGGPGHEEWTNVTLLDHVLDVGLGAANLLLLDRALEGDDPDVVVDLAAVAIACGFAHDVDKYFAKPWKDITADDFSLFDAAYALCGWLSSQGVPISPRKLWELCQAVEVRSAPTAVVSSITPRLLQTCRIYVKAADQLHSTLLNGVPGSTGENVSAKWEAIRRDFGLSAKFASYRPLIVRDPALTFILDVFWTKLGEACEAVSGLPPLFHTISDAEILTLLPEDSFSNILETAISETGAAIPFETTFSANAQGGYSLSGGKPGSWQDIRQTVFEDEWLKTNDARRLFSVKKADFQKFKGQIIDLLVKAGIGANDNPKEGALVVVAANPPDDNLSVYGEAVAALLSFAVGAPSTDRRLSPRDRVDLALTAAAEHGHSCPAWIDETELLTQRALKGVWLFERSHADQRVRDSLEGLRHEWFKEEGVFGGYSNPSETVRNAVMNRLAALTGRSCPQGQAVTGQYCIMTGEPATRQVSGADGLYGVKSSAISYREGRSEYRNREVADVYVSDATYGELRLRSAINARGIGGDGIPVAVCSNISAGLLGMQIMRNVDPVEYSTYDILRKDRSKDKVTFDYNPATITGERYRIARFETLPAKFVDRLDFFRRLLEVARRTGRPLHVFQGLPHGRREFFYSDCLGSALEQLLGGAGLRIEQTAAAIERLGIIATIARSPDGPNDPSLNDVSLAKALCMPKTRFFAGCEAWSRLRDKGAEVLQKRVGVILDQEVARMDQDQTAISVIELGKLARKVQYPPRFNDSANEESFLIRTALEAAERAYAKGTRDTDEMVAFVAGAIRDEGKRRDAGRFFFVRGKGLEDAISEFSTAFVQGIWQRRFGGRPASTADKKGLISAYRWSFLRAPEPDRGGHKDEETAVAAE